MSGPTKGRTRGGASCVAVAKAAEKPFEAEMKAVGLASSPLFCVYQDQ